MNDALADYIAKAKGKGHDDARIRADLVAGGWDQAAVDAALGGGDNLVVPAPPAASPTAPAGQLMKVVPYRSTAGLEYLIMFLSLWIFSLALAGVLHDAVDTLSSSTDSFYQNTVSFAMAALVVSLPIFAYLFLRLKKQELANPDIRRDINRKNAVQLTLLVTFLIGVGRTIFYIYQLLNSNSGNNGSLLDNLGHTIVTVGIAGTIFVYYWKDDHKVVV